MSLLERRADARLPIFRALAMLAPGRTEPVNKDQHGIPNAQIHRRPTSADSSCVRASRS